MATTYLALVNGKTSEVVAITASAGISSAGAIPALDANGRLDLSFMPVGIGPDTYTGTAFENLAAGAFVYIRSDGKIANAVASVGGHYAEGFVLQSAAANATGVMVYFDGVNTALTGLTPDTRYYLSATTPGGATTTPVSAQGAGSIHQVLGMAITANSFQFNDTDYIVKAA